ncbi:MAG: PaREP1 family protein [Candidatus Bathyarchaeia archaeon]
MEDAEKYAEQSLRYLENALLHLNQGDYDKASEFLWGSVAEAVKAVAASRGLNLTKHVELWEFVGELAKELDEESIYDNFRTANYLHSNFYEIELRPEEVLDASESVRQLVACLLELVAKK